MTAYGERRAVALAAACHEAAHCVVAAACGLPLAAAFARDGRGEMQPDAAACAMLLARRKRRGLPPASGRGALAGTLGALAVILAGAAGPDARARARPGAAWLRYPLAASGLSRGDLRAAFGQTEALRAAGIPPGAAWAAVADWNDALLDRHAETFARLAAALLKRRRLSGSDLDRILAPVTADTVPFHGLLALAARLAADPAARWPVPPQGEAPHAAA